jgi:hypothetical protein
MVAPTANRVAMHTSPQTNARIHGETERNIAYYSSLGRQAIERRLTELDREWDIERALEANAASATLFGFIMGTLWNRKWFILPGVVGGFLLQHAIDGWCPPLPIMRRLGFRTAQEIEYERHALLRVLEKSTV